jgi:hypothetical protein
MRKNILLFVLVCVLCLLNQYTFAQINEGGEPMSFSLNIDRINVPVLTMPSIDRKTLIIENEKAEKEDVQRPFRFGYAIEVDIDMKKDGIRKELQNGDNLWLLKIHSSDAFSINLIFNHFRLSEGSRFFVYNEDRTMILGAFTPEVSNNPYNKFAIDLIQGNTIVLEYYETKYSVDGVINISKVIHGYINTFSDGYGSSAGCNIDVNCPLGDGWENEKRAVSMILVDDNTALCTGCLINNALQDLTPYYLTADHCFFDDIGNLTSDPATAIFRFQYWRPNCGTGNPNNWVSITGATILANYFQSDFALLRLNQSPPADYNVYYAGWDKTTTPAQNATTIHHAGGDVMKISHDTDNVISVMYWDDLYGYDHWKAVFDQGTVQHGSSGAPLFNQNQRIVGQLHSGVCRHGDNTCYCNNPEGKYGRFDFSWIGGGTNSTRLSNWLDPNGTGVPFLDGCGTNFTNRTITINTTFNGCNNVNVQNVTVSNNVKLKLNAPGEVTIDGNFEIGVGSELEIK